VSIPLAFTNLKSFLDSFYHHARVCAGRASLIARTAKQAQGSLPVSGVICPALAQHPFGGRKSSAGALVRNPENALGCETPSFLRRQESPWGTPFPLVEHVETQRLLSRQKKTLKLRGPFINELSSSSRRAFRFHQCRGIVNCFWHTCQHPGLKDMNILIFD